MKKLIILPTLFAMLTIATVSCQKESLRDQRTHYFKSHGYHTICYYVNGTVHRCTITSDNDWSSLMEAILSFARQGYTVCMRYDNNNFSNSYVKETIKYTTTNKDDAIKWSQNKIIEGYAVTVNYDEETGEYTCIATR